MLITEIFERIEREIENNKNSVIVVEGRKDELALKAIGFKNIVTISGKSPDELADLVKVNDSVIVLTDFDKEGKEKMSYLVKLFQKNNIKINSFIRKKIRRLFGITKIEELRSFTKLMEDGYYGKTCSIYDKIFNRGRVLNRRSCRKARCDRSDFWSDRGFARSGP